jgi:hypothetical protein
MDIHLNSLVIRYWYTVYIHRSLIEHSIQALISEITINHIAELTSLHREPAGQFHSSWEEHMTCSSCRRVQCCWAVSRSGLRNQNQSWQRPQEHTARSWSLWQLLVVEHLIVLDRWLSASHCSIEADCRSCSMTQLRASHHFTEFLLVNETARFVNTLYTDIHATYIHRNPMLPRSCHGILSSLGRHFYRCNGKENVLDA